MSARTNHKPLYLRSTYEKVVELLPYGLPDWQVAGNANISLETLTAIKEEYAQKMGRPAIPSGEANAMYQKIINGVNVVNVDYNEKTSLMTVNLTIGDIKPAQLPQATYLVASYVEKMRELRFNLATGL